MRPLSHTERAVEYRDGRILAQRDRDDRMHDLGHELGMAEAESDLAGFARKFVRDPRDTPEANARRFIAEFVGHCDCCYDVLSEAIRQATGICVDEHQPIVHVRLGDEL
ncbi:hypothetical protein [Burkholderia gladioli]|uniref:hypothetical protein n=1 Tax=Burkholderia gladioli TaxID=28095 RepID=UPI0016419B83|nr:hypothetical protein [Burkholderia gladioli]